MDKLVLFVSDDSVLLSYVAVVDDPPFWQPNPTMTKINSMSARHQMSMLVLTNIIFFVSLVVPPNQVGVDHTWEKNG